MIINHIKKNYYYLISLSILIYLIASGLILHPFKQITLALFSLLLFFAVVQNLNDNIKIQINIFLLFSYLLLFILDFNIEKIIFKSCVRTSCYMDYIQNNKNKNLKFNLFGKNFIDNKELLPLSTYPNSNILGSNENGYWPIFKSDRYGFNNNDDIYNNKKISNLIIGDSYAQGATVNYEDSIQNLLTKKNHVTLSFGVGGNGPLLNLATFIEYSRDIKYENLIYFFTETNDLYYDISIEKKNIILQKYLSGNYHQNLIFKQKELSFELNNKSRQIYNDYVSNNKIDIKKIFRKFTLPNTRSIFNIVNTGEINNYNNLQIPSDQILKKKDLYLDAFHANFRIQNKVLNIINDSTNKINYYLIYIPERKHFLENKKTKLFEIIREMSLKNNFEFIDIYEEIDLSFRKKLYPRNYKHFNEEGQRKISEIILTKIN